MFKQLTLNLFDTKQDNKSTPDMQEKLKECDRILLAISGGKDSVCCLELMVRMGFKNKIELHHHDVDGGEETFFDWAITQSYVQAIAKHYEVPLFISYRVGGFKKEMLRSDEPTAEVRYQIPGGEWRSTGGKGKSNTRRKFPMPSFNLLIRWCSSYLKIAVFAAVIANQKRFDGKKICVVTGERAEESAARAKYPEIEPHRTNCQKREVWHCRPILHWSTEKVWCVMQEAGIVAHPAYYLGYSRCSCRSCIFLNVHDWATLKKIDPEIIKTITNYETEFNSTISYDKQRKKKGLPQLNTAEKAKLGTARKIDPKWKAIANSKVWDMTIYVNPKDWELPIGAFGDLHSGSP